MKDDRRRLEANLREPYRRSSTLQHKRLGYNGRVKKQNLQFLQKPNSSSRSQLYPSSQGL